jgi:hypothetical protein
VRVEIMPFAHIFREGSRIRIAVDTPGDSCADWTFILQEFTQDPIHSVAHQEAYPSSVVLPVIPGVEVPTGLPDYTALRGQAWRSFEDYVNQPDRGERSSRDQARGLRASASSSRVV